MRRAFLVAMVGFVAGEASPVTTTASDQEISTSSTLRGRALYEGHIIRGERSSEGKANSAATSNQGNNSATYSNFSDTFANSTVTYYDINTGTYTSGNQISASNQTSVAPLINPQVVLVDEMDDEDHADRCAQRCSAEYSCNDYKIGSNQLFSCAQACMIRARGTSLQDCVSVVNTQATELGCSRTVNGFQYGFCGTCSDNKVEHPHGVHGYEQPGVDGCTIF